MSRTIWKFPIARYPEVFAPADARVILCGIDPAGEGPAVWLELDEDAPRVSRCFVIHGTGARIEDQFGQWHEHVGSMFDRSFVWHVYEVKS